MIEIKDFNIEKSGVYFLLNDDELIYIGETKILKKRLKEHKNGVTFCGIFIIYPKEFNRVWFEEINLKKERKLKEKIYIYEYQPKYNCVTPEQIYLDIHVTDKDVLDDFSKVKFRNE